MPQYNVQGTREMPNDDDRQFSAPVTADDESSAREKFLEEVEEQDQFSIDNIERKV